MRAVQRLSRLRMQCFEDPLELARSGQHVGVRLSHVASEEELGAAALSGREAIRVLALFRERHFDCDGMVSEVRVSPRHGHRGQSQSVAG